MKRYYSANDYFKKVFVNKENGVKNNPQKIYKIAINAGFTCPNRDGTKAYGGCIFCKNGSGDFAKSGTDIKTQIKEAKALINKKAGQNAKYICYLQAFSNTYGSIEHLEKIYRECLSDEETVAISIATRPDCISRETANLLGALNKEKPIFVELGLQTSNEETAKIINRNFTNEEYVSAVKFLKENGINVITHIIIGLLNETAEDNLKTLKFVTDNKSDGVKFQLLHILKGTPLEKMQQKTLSKEEYFYILGVLINHTPKNTVIHRLTGDGNKKYLLAPLWSANKKDVLNSLNIYLEQNNIIQGKDYVE